MKLALICMHLMPWMESIRLIKYWILIKEMSKMTDKIKTYSEIDSTILKSIPNPAGEAYEIKIEIPECTFLGVKEQPDFATIYLTFYPSKKIIELKSLKKYIFQLRKIVVSYERFIKDRKSTR